MEHKEFITNLKGLVGAASIVLIALATSKFLTYVFRVIVARYYGPEVYGMFSLGMMALGFFMTLSILGFSDGLARFISLYRGKRDINKIRYIFRASIKTLAVSSIVSAALIYFSSDYLAIEIFKNPELSAFLKIFAIAVPIGAVSSPLLSSLRAYEKITAFSLLYNVSQNVARILFLAVLILLGAGNITVALSYVAGYLATFVLSFYTVKAITPEVLEKPKLDRKKKRETFNSLISYSLPLVVSSMVFVFLTWTDSFLVGYFKGTEAVGIYNAAVPIAALLAIATEIFVQLFFPLINKEYAMNKKTMVKNLSKQVAKWILIINAPLFILLFLFPGTAINILFGPEYLPALHSLRILIFGTLLLSFLSISQHLISMVGKSKIILLDIILATILNIVLNILLIPKGTILSLDNSQGLTGASLSTTISYIFLSLLLLIQSKYYLHIIPLRRKMLNALLSILPALILLSLMKMYVPINAITATALSIIFLILYIISLFILRALDKDDMEIISSIIKKLRNSKGS